MSSRRRRGRNRDPDRRISLRGGGLLHNKRRPASREGGYLRSERRQEGPGRGTDAAGDRIAEAGDGEREGSGVRLHRRRRRPSEPAAGVATLAALLLFVLALIFLL